MSFDNDHPGRKDHRKPYRKSKRWDRSCRNHGSWIASLINHAEGLSLSDFRLSAIT